MVVAIELVSRPEKGNFSNFKINLKKEKTVFQMSNNCIQSMAKA